MTDYVEVKESPKWGELKKEVIVDGNKVITKDGEIVEGITAQERQPIFEVEL